MLMLIKKIGLFSLPLLLYGVCITLADPFNYFNSNFIFDRDEKKAQANPINQALWKVLEQRGEYHANVILGDSRMHRLTVNFIEDMTGERFTNLAFPGGSIPEIVNSFWFLKDRVNLKRVYFGINFDIYNARLAWDRFEGARTMLDNPFLYLTNRDVLEASLKLYRSTADRAGGESKTQSSSQPDKQKFWRFFIKNSLRKKLGSYIYPQSYYLELQKISQYCRENHIDFNIVIFPTHSDINSLMDEYQLRADFERFKVDMRSLGTVYDFHLPNSFSENQDLFRDPLHPVRSIYQQMAFAIWDTSRLAEGYRKDFYIKYAPVVNERSQHSE